MASPDYFKLLGLARDFALDEAALAAAYAGRAAAGPGPELDEARRVLADPERRADHLLTLIGGPAAADVTDLWAGHRQAGDDLRRRWAEALASNDAAAAAEVRQAVDAERRARLDRVAALFRALTKHDNPVVRRDRLREVRMQLNALRELRGIGAGVG